MIDFPRPDAAARAKLWKLNIPPRAPCDSDVDAELFGKEFKLSGGQIRNAALHAAFLAASDSQIIGLKHITRAVWTEFSKKAGELSVSSLGSLACHLPSEVNDDSN